MDAYCDRCDWSQNGQPVAGTHCETCILRPPGFGVSELDSWEESVEEDGFLMGREEAP